MSELTAYVLAFLIAGAMAFGIMICFGGALACMAGRPLTTVWPRWLCRLLKVTEG